MNNKNLMFGLGIFGVSMGSLYYIMKLQNEENCKRSYQRGLQQREKIIYEIERKYEKKLKEKDEKIDFYQEKVQYIKKYVDSILGELKKDGNYINNMKINTGSNNLNQIIKDTFLEKCYINIQKEYVKIFEDKTLTPDEKSIKAIELFNKFNY